MLTLNNYYGLPSFGIVMGKKLSYDALLLQNKEQKAKIAALSVQLNTSKTYQEGGERYKSLFDTNLEIIYIHDFEGHFIDANPTALSTFGYERSEITDYNFSTFIDEHQLAIAKNEMQQLVIKGYQDKIIEYKVKTKSGNFIYLETNASLLYQHGQPYAIQTLARDITHRKIVNALALELASFSPGSNMYLFIARRLKEITGAVIVSIGEYLPQSKEIGLKQLETNSLFINTAKRILGIHPIKLKIPVSDDQYRDMMSEGLNFKNSLSEMSLGSISPKIGLMFEKLFSLQRFAGISFIVEGKLYGTATLVFTKEAPAPSQELIKSICQIIAVSLRRKDVEEKYYHTNIELKQSEEKFRQLAENTDEMFCLLSDKEIIYVNPAFEAIWGYTCPELYKNPKILTESIYPEDQKEAVKIFKFPKIRKKKFINTDLRIVRRDNSVRWINAKSFPISNESGEILRWLYVVRDISEKKQFEKEIIQAKEKAEESDTLKSSFLANMSHEIRSPMNSIIGFSEILSKPGLSSDKKERYTEIIKQRSYDLLRIIEDILDVSKIEVGQMNVVKSEITLSDILNEVYECHVLKIRNSRTDLDFKIRCPDHMTNFKIQTDSQLLKQVLNNLIENAIKFTAKGSIEIGCEMKNPVTVLFFVKDTGIGIPEDKLDLIFDRFRQAEEASATRMYGGTGLGLSIVKGIVMLLKGKIWVKSVVTKGSQFYFSLPIILE